MAAKTALDVDDSYYEEPLEELRCEWPTADASGFVTVQLSTASNFIGYDASFEGTGGGEYTEAEALEGGRRYDEGLLIAKRNGFTVVETPDIDLAATEDQVDAIALEATEPG